MVALLGGVYAGGGAVSAGFGLRVGVGVWNGLVEVVDSGWKDDFLEGTDDFRNILRKRGTGILGQADGGDDM